MCRHLNLSPAKGTRKLLDNTGMIFKSEAGRIAVFYEESRLDTMKMYMDDPFDPFCFYFTAQTSDPSFFNYTQDAGDPSSATTLFLRPGSVKSDPCRLTRKPWVSIEDHDQGTADPVLADLMAGSIKSGRPLFIISLFPDPKAGVLFSKKGQVLGQTFHATFSTRETRWKYLISGKSDPVQVVDRDGKIHFAKTEPPDLPLSNPVQAFISDQAIALTENSCTNFDLKDEVSGALLMKHLPPASPDILFKSKDTGTAGYISEIFINI